MPVGAILWRVAGHYDHLHVETTYAWECVPLGHWIESQGGRCGENPAFGGVCRSCHSGRAHYEGRALDVNLGYGNPSGERAFLDRLRSQLYRGLDVTRLKVGTMPYHPPPVINPKDTQEDDLTADQAKKLNEVHDWLEDLRGWVGSMDATDPGMVHRVKGIETRVRALDRALLSTNATEPGLVHVLKNETTKLVWRMAKAMGVPT